MTGADPLSLATAIKGLLPLVEEEFALIRDAFISDRELRFHLGRVELQKVIFQAWENGWMDSRERPDQKLMDFAIAKPFLAAEILQQLFLFLRSFTDPDKLQKRYGLSVQSAAANRLGDLAADMNRAAGYLYNFDSLRLTREYAMTFEEDLARHLDFLQKIRFLPTATEHEIESIVARLDELNHRLQLFAADNLRDRRVFELIVRDIKGDPDRAKRLAEAAAYESKYSLNPEAKQTLDDWSKFANFSLALQSASADAMSRKKIFSRSDFSFDSPFKISANSTLARLFDYPTKYQSRLVLVEWVRIQAAKMPSIAAKLDEMKIAWYVLHAERPEKMLLPGSIGLIYDDSEPQEIGYVFQLPSHIRSNLPTKHATGPSGDIGHRVVRSSMTIAAQRMPTSLRQLIKKESRGLDLGIRFTIAKKLLDSLHLMHAAGFIHRNIRPDNILLFPSKSPRDGEPDPAALDFANPLLVGFHHASLEIEVPPQEQHNKPIEGLKPILKNKNPARVVAIDCYQHMDRRLDPTCPYRRRYDLYAIGCVLLELGLWETLDCVSGKDIAARACHPTIQAADEDIWLDARIVCEAASQLDSITGSIYANVTRECLLQSPVTVDIVELERELAGALSKCHA